MSCYIYCYKLIFHPIKVFYPYAYEFTDMIMAYLYTYELYIGYVYAYQLPVQIQVGPYAYGPSRVGFMGNPCFHRMCMSSYPYTYRYLLPRAYI